MNNLSLEAMREKLDESISRFKETAELLPTIICEFDLNMRFTYTNRLGLELFGYTAEELERGIHMTDVVDDIEYEKMKKNVAVKLSGGELEPQVYTLRFKNGKTRDFYICSSVMCRNNQVIGLRCCLTDITPLKEAECKLKESEERFRSIFAGSPIGVAVCNYDGRIVDMNESFKRMFGLAQLVTGKELMISLFENLPFMKGVQESIDEGNVFQHESDWDFMFAKVDDSYNIIHAGNRCLEWQIISLQEGTSGRIFLVQVQDITERKKKVEEQLALERKATQKARQIAEELQRKISKGELNNTIVSKSDAMQKIMHILPEVSQTDVTVLITGESGTGKERIARTIHALSSRRDKPFIAINCGALPDTLLESELFGHKAGAFTDAKKDKMGKFQLAEGGTLFLDEIGEMTPAMQVKLLRVIQERCFEPLGGTKPISLNVRLITATNRDLTEMVKNGTFREDLYYRVKVVSVDLPPLRERKSDIPLLIDYFIKKFNAHYQKNIEQISQSALAILLAHNYSGNVRELEHILEHAFIFCRGSVIEPAHLPKDIIEGQESVIQTENYFETLSGLQDLEQQYFQYLMGKYNGNRYDIANFLGVHRSTLFRKLRELGLE